MKEIKELCRKILIVFMTVLMSGVSMLGIRLDDTYTPGTFPIYAPEAQTEGTIRVMSFNIRYADVNGVPATLRRTIVYDEICAVNPDSFGVQEAKLDWMTYLRLMLTDYKSVGNGRDGGSRGEHNAIFYRSDKYDLIDSGTFWLSDTPDKPSMALDAACRRVCTWAVLEDKASSMRYVHVNSHFDNRGEEARKFEAEMVSSFIDERFADLPVVFTADLNSFSYETAYRTMTRSLIDTRETADKSEVYSTFHDGDPENCYEVIDYILCSDDFHAVAFKTVTAGIDGRFVSDHFPIYADLRLQ